MKRSFRTLPAALAFDEKPSRALWAAAALCASIGILLFLAFWVQVASALQQGDRVIKAGYLAEQARQFSSALVLLEARSAVLGKINADDEAVKRMNRDLDGMDEQLQRLEETAKAVSLRRLNAVSQLNQEWIGVKAAVYALSQASAAAPVSPELSDAVSSRISAVHKRLAALMAAAEQASSESAGVFARWRKTFHWRIMALMFGLLALFLGAVFCVQEQLAKPLAQARCLAKSESHEFSYRAPQMVEPPLENRDDQV